MKVLLKSVKIIDPNSSFHNKELDIFIENGKIKDIGKSINASNNTKVLEITNCHISPGWFDMYAHLCDPGYEHREDLHSGMSAAAAGGFTGVLMTPETDPPLHSKAEIEYILNNTKTNIVDVYPAGAITKRLQGKEISEMLDMHHQGAIAFTDGDQAISDAGIMLKALQYVKAVDGLIISHSEDGFVARDGVMNEGIMSTRLGLKGIPAIAEELIAMRDIRLAEYAGGSIHFAHISTKRAVELIQRAKKNGLNITAGVAAYHLHLEESMLEDYDTNYKVTPPLRTKSDIQALKKALNSGVLDVVCSNHKPQNEEVKKVEFDYAENGMINFETAFAILNTAVSDTLDITQIIEKIAINPRKILKLDIPKIEIGAYANITLFNPSKKWTFERKDIHSKSKNTPYIGTVFTGKPLGIINNNKLYLNSN